MRASTLVFAALAIAAGRVVAQDPTDTETADGPDATDGPDGTTDPTECVMTCAMNSMSASGCANMNDVTCLCTSTAYSQAVAQWYDFEFIWCFRRVHEADIFDSALLLPRFNPSPVTDPTESVSASASSAVASVTSAASAAASSVRASTSSAARSSASVVSASHSASASASGNAATALKMPSVSYMALGATALGFVVGPLLLFA
ncbi:hypothetical protein FS837_007553 [Tulasnella sp. UAMH 9824]|nr:hypothetical protein FS837_007553 [Tulasnella sp. UAMH 9824]